MSVNEERIYCVEEAMTSLRERISELEKSRDIFSYTMLKKEIAELREDFEFVSEDDMVKYFYHRKKVVVKREDLQFLIEMAGVGCEECFDFDADEYQKFRRIKEEKL